MNEHIRQAGRFVQDAVKQTIRDQEDHKHQQGFTAAASISLHQIQAKLDLFKEQMRGPGLSKAEQMVYSQLEDLKTDLKAGFDRYWRHTDVDWRPAKPVAKGVVKQAGSPQ